MELLIIIVKQTQFLDDILTGFVDVGIHGATVIDSRGMGQILTANVPIFAGLKDLMPGGNIGNYMIMSVVESAQVEKAIALIKETCGDLNKEGVGIAFTLPLKSVFGLIKEKK
jgi:nitrogen regulatory protein PII